MSRDLRRASYISKRVLILLVRLNLVSSRTTSSTLIYIPAIHKGVKMASNASCFAPDGTLVTTWSPCNSTEDGRVSACCELGSSVCTTTGLCVGSAEYFYRGGCTDPSWRSPSCPSQCATSKSLSHLMPLRGFLYYDLLDLKTSLSLTGYAQFANPLSPIFILASRESLTLTDSFAVAWTRVAVRKISPCSAFTNAVVSSTPILTSTLCADHSNGPSPVTVGRAVGAILGGLLLAFLILFIFRERHWRNKAHSIQLESEKRAWELQQLSGKVGTTENAYPFYGSPSEMPTDQHFMVEAPTITDPQEVSGYSSLPNRTAV